MTIHSLTLSQFRNHASRGVTFVPGVNVIRGDNAAGKTNIAEAIYMLAKGRSFRPGGMDALVRSGQTSAAMGAVIDAGGRTLKYEYTMTLPKAKRVTINGVPVRRMTELLARFNVVLLHPYDLRVIRQSPADRRQMLDVTLSSADKTYLEACVKYQKALEARNRALRVGSGDAWVWDQLLLRYGVILHDKRRAYVEQWARHARDAYGIFGEAELCISYHSGITGRVLGITGGADADTLDIPSYWKEKLSRDRPGDLTRYGPHRDDLVVTVGGYAAQHYCSEGQLRSILFSMRLAEHRVITGVIGEPPVLILDDVFNELDATRQQRVLEAAADTQVIITTHETSARFDAASEAAHLIEL